MCLVFSTLVGVSEGVSLIRSEGGDSHLEQHKLQAQSCSHRAKQMVISHQIDAAAHVHSDAHIKQSCDEQFAEQSKVVKGYMSNASSRVLLFGWIDCPCTGIAQSRFAGSNVCFESLTWLYPSSKLMAYLQCKEKRSDIHSFVYFRGAANEWSMVGSGFDLDPRAMKELTFKQKVGDAKASLTCKQANIKVNLYGTPLEACQDKVGDKYGSWSDDGTCSEQVRGVHEICIDGLPADFSTETHQPAWSTMREGKRHCVCIGAWSLYMTDMKKHVAGADKIMPHCKSIPETALTHRYLQQWGNWNGYPADVALSAKEMVNRCMQAPGLTDHEKCGLRQRYLAFREDVPDVKKAAHIDIDGVMDKIQC